MGIDATTIFGSENLNLFFFFFDLMWFRFYFVVWTFFFLGNRKEILKIQIMWLLKKLKTSKIFQQKKFLFHLQSHYVQNQFSNIFFLFPSFLIKFNFEDSIVFFFFFFFFWKIVGLVNLLNLEVLDYY